MTKFIAKNRIEHGQADKDGKNNVVTIVEEGATGDLPEAVVAALVESGAAELAGKAAPAAKE